MNKVWYRDRGVVGRHPTNSLRRCTLLSSEMDVFRKNYSVYCTVLSLAGLWPYDESLLGKVQRVVVSSLILSCIVVQISSLKFVEASLSNIVTVLSYSFPMFLYFLRYIGFVVNFPVIRSLFENVGKDCTTLENSVEVEMLMKHMADARRVILAYIALPSIVAVYVCVTILVPTLLHSKLQLHYMHMFGFFYNEQGYTTDWVCAYLVLVCVLGQITIAGTESSLAVFSAYLCGLFDIASYRIENAVNKMVNSVTLDLIDVQPAVQIHQRAIELVSTSRYFSNTAVYFIIFSLRFLFTLHFWMVNALEYYKFLNRELQQILRKT